MSFNALEFQREQAKLDREAREAQDRKLDRFSRLRKLDFLLFDLVYLLAKAERKRDRAGAIILSGAIERISEIAKAEAGELFGS